MHPLLLDSTSVFLDRTSGDQLRQAAQRRLVRKSRPQAAESRRREGLRLQRAPAR